MRMGHREEGGDRGRGHRGESHGHGHGHRGSRGFQGGREARGAQTFRRGRVLMFLEQLRVKRATLARQLAQPEFEAIRPVLSGELKALDQVIEEYVHLFDLQEVGEEPAPQRPADEGEGNN
ncbi:hypothetical protein [Cohnella sp.]|uniref:hypothetical protein n=1 Tax=Cohnella sp. TaxID=1883426 RepID=UPI00356600EC